MADSFFVEATDPDTWETTGYPRIGNFSIGPDSGVVEIPKTPHNEAAVAHFVNEAKKLRFVDAEQALQAHESEDDTENQESENDLDPDRCQYIKPDGDQCLNSPKSNGYCGIPVHQEAAEH